MHHRDVESLRLSENRLYKYRQEKNKKQFLILQLFFTVHKFLILRLFHLSFIFAPISYFTMQAYNTLISFASILIFVAFVKDNVSMSSIPYFENYVS